MANLLRIHARVRSLQNAIQQVSNGSLKDEMQTALIELRAIIEQIELDQAKSSEAEAVGRKIKKVADFVNWLESVWDIFT